MFINTHLCNTSKAFISVLTHPLHTAPHKHSLAHMCLKRCWGAKCRGYITNYRSVSSGGLSFLMITLLIKAFFCFPLSLFAGAPLRPAAHQTKHYSYFCLSSTISPTAPTSTPLFSSIISRSLKIKTYFRRCN